MSADPLAALATMDVSKYANDFDAQAEHASVEAQTLAQHLDDDLQFTGLAADPLIQTQQNALLASAQSSFSVPEFTLQSGVDVLSAARHEFVFVDTAVEDFATLLQGLGLTDPATFYDVVLLHTEADGVTQITATLADQEGVDAIHVIAHGSDGSVTLGNAQLSSQTLANYADDFASWSMALDDDADLLIYGCNLAASEVGESLLRSLQQLTGADVAASDDLTGNASAQADWELEYHLGNVETSVFASQAAQQAWEGTLAYESFSYMPGSLSGLNGGTGWAGAWASQTGFTVRVAGLDIPTGTLAVAGGSVASTGGSLTHSRDLATALGTDGTTAWFSVLLEADTRSGRGIGLVLGESEDDIVTIGLNDDDFKITRDYSAAAGASIDGLIVDGETYFLTARIEFFTGNDTITLYVNPTPGLAAPDSVLSVQYSGADLGSFTRVGIGGGFLGSNTKIDEIRSGSTFAEVAPNAAGNLAPTLTAFAAAVETTAEDTEVQINFAELAAKGNESDADGTVKAFVVQSVTNGSLRIGTNSGSATAWVAGVNNVIDGATNAYWTPDSDAVGLLSAFTLTARDNGGLDSVTTVTAQIRVLGTSVLPTIGNLANPLESTLEDTQVEIDFAELLRAADEDDADGTVESFVVQRVSSGSLMIGANAARATAWAAGSNDVIDADNNAYWTPDANANGLLDAFSVSVRDNDGLDSVTAVTAQVDVRAVNDAPTLGALRGPVATTEQALQVGIEFAELLSATQVVDVDGDVVAFLVRDPGAGTLLIGANTATATPWAAGRNDRIDANNAAFWTPTADATGIQEAFTIVALDDGGLESRAPVAVPINVTASIPPVEPPVEPPIEPPVEPPIEPPAELPPLLLTPDEQGSPSALPGGNQEVVDNNESAPAVEEAGTEPEAPALQESVTEPGAVIESARLISGLRATNFAGVSVQGALEEFGQDFNQSVLAELTSLFGDSSEVSSLTIAKADDFESKTVSLFENVSFAGLSTGFESVVDPLVLLTSQNYSDELDKMREELRQELRTDQSVLGGSVTVTAGLSVGYLVWLTRSGALLGAAMSALPAWRFVDPLPILASGSGGIDSIDDEDDDESLESMVSAPAASMAAAQDGAQREASEKKTESEVEA